MIDLLRGMLRVREIDDDMEAFFADFTLRHGRRPTALETWTSDFDPRAPNHGGWVAFLRHMGEPIQDAVVEAGQSLFRDIGRRADEAALRWLSGAVDAGLVEGVMPPAEGRQEWAFWAENQLTEREGALRLSRIPSGNEETMRALLRELLDWRLAVIGEEVPAPPPTGMEEGQAPYDATPAPILWQSYDRPDIAPLFGATFSTGSWNQGIVRVDNRLILLTTLRKGSNHYEDRFLDAQTIQWQSQTSTRKASRHGEILSGREAGSEVHLFLRAGKLRKGKAAPFTYCGRVRFRDWEGERPITIRFALPEPVPEHLWTVFGIEA